MKRLLIGTLLVAACGLLFAQEGNRRSQKAEPEKVTVSGKLSIARGMIALESGNSVYYVPELLRFAGFIDGLKEGASVTLEGYEVPVRFTEEDAGKGFRVTKMTLNGKEYDVGFQGTRNRDSRQPVSPSGFGRMRNFRFDQGPDPRDGKSRYPQYRE
jgi:hypothetical protein